MKKHLQICSLIVMCALAAAMNACERKDAVPQAQATAPTAAAKPSPVTPIPPVTSRAASTDAEKSAFDAFAKSCGLPVARAPLVAKAPVVDGAMDDAYKLATPMAFKFLDGKAEAPKAVTTAYAVCTADTLFVFFQCAAPNTPKLVANVTEHDGHVWEDESVELFLDPANRRASPIMHVLVNSKGVTCDGKDTDGDMDTDWDPKLAVRTIVDMEAWTCEIALPFAELGLKSGDVPRVWAANFNRMARLTGGTEDIAWSPTGSKISHVPEKFGWLWVDAGTVDNSKNVAAPKPAVPK